MSTNIVREIVKQAIGPDFSEEIFQKAVGKAKRWMKLAYGAVDWDSFLAENGGASIVVYYRETLEKPDGRGTFNHATHGRRR
jgi:hypothetical protein